jgi:hypothetical protein
MVLIFIFPAESAVCEKMDGLGGLTRFRWKGVSWGFWGRDKWLLVILIPEIVFISTAVAVWRKRRSMAVGILLSAAILIVHFIVHITTHG